MDRLAKISLAAMTSILCFGWVAWVGVVGSDIVPRLAAYVTSLAALHALTNGETDEAARLYRSLSDPGNSFPIPAETIVDAHLGLGNIASGSGDFLEARNHYLEAAPMRSENEFRRLYNLGNVEYRLGESASSDANRILLWLSAIGRYEDALAWHEDTETRENLEFVKRKLEDLAQTSKPENQTEGRDPQQGSPNESQGDSPTEQQWQGAAASWERIPQSGGIWRNTGEFESVWNGGESEESLSESERQWLENRMRSIGELGATGQEYLRRDGTPRSGGSGPFFNIIPLLNDNTSSVEKDW